MNSTQKKQLQIELQAAGASEIELKDLTGIAAGLGKLRSAKVQADAPPRKKFQLFLAVGIPSTLCLIAGVLLVMIAQSVLPGSPLYTVQKMSDNVAISADASYRGIVMMKRADQVRALVNNHASSDTVLATLADYQKQAAHYKSTKANYAAFEYCEQSLKQAAAMAPNPEKQAITNTLQSLNSA